MSCVLTLPKTDIVFQARTFWLACVQTQAQSVQLVVGSVDSIKRSLAETLRSLGFPFGEVHARSGKRV